MREVYEICSYQPFYRVSILVCRPNVLFLETLFMEIYLSTMCLAGR
jgi:hypothetical protein